MSVAAVAAAPIPTFTEWLSAELDQKLASLPNDQARYRELILQGNAWSIRFEKFLNTGRQPFDGPHPVYGPMDMFIFRLLLCDIELRKTLLIRGKA